ncbi:NAD(P)-dependent oxidoreductase [Roseateles asaccharophilus]
MVGDALHRVRSVADHASSNQFPQKRGVMTSTQPIALLGLGAMGSRMAARLLAAGHDVVGWNRSPAPLQWLRTQGGRTAASPREAVAGARVVFSMVRDDEASRSVWLDADHGAAAALDTGAIGVECSTLSPAWIEELAASLAVPLVDAPVAGSRSQAEAGQLIFMAGGPHEAVQRVTPLLLQMGSDVHAVGANGSGSALKLAVNSLFAAQVAVMAEQLAALAHQQVALPVALAALKAMPVTSPAAAGAAAAMLAGAYAPQFPVQLMAKDLAYALAAGGQRLPLTESILARFQAAREAGLGDEHVVALHKLYR